MEPSIRMEGCHTPYIPLTYSVYSPNIPLTCPLYTPKIHIIYPLTYRWCVFWSPLNAQGLDKVIEGLGGGGSGHESCLIV